MECEIRKWNLSDAPYLADALNNKKVMDNLKDGLPYPYTVEDAQKYIKKMNNTDPDEVFAFAITVNNKAVGNMNVIRKKNIHYRTAEIGYYISEAYWGKGIGTIAVLKTCNYIFKNTDIVRIYAKPFAYSEASCRILEKAGFVCEGTLRKNAVKNGKVIDMKMYAKIK